MKSLRIDTSELISGALVIGETGLGVLGSDIPSTGTSGPPPLYNDISLPSEANDEFRALLLTVPSGGSFFMFEDSRFIASGYADGSYSGTYEGFKNGTSYGTASYSFTIGAVEITGDLAKTLGNATLSSAGAVSIGGIVSKTLAIATLSSVGGVSIVGSLAAALGSCALSATGAISNTGALESTLADATLSAEGTGASGGIVGATLAPATLSSTGGITLSGALSKTLGDATLVAVGANLIVGSASIDLADCTIVATATGPGGGGADPAAVWNYVLPNGYSAIQILEILTAVAAGKTRITNQGGGQAFVEFDAIDDSHRVVAADMTGSERTDMTLTP